VIPAKPFDSYKWRWLSVAPTEGLLKPPVFLGVLRVLGRHENEAPSSQAIANELAIVKAETGTTVNLVRTPERNLIRNSGQYWKGTGLLASDDGEIHLTKLGRLVAQSKITEDEFAATVIQQTVLPNPWTYPATEMAKWAASNLKISPFLVILSTIQALGIARGRRASFLTPDELVRVVIPLAGVGAAPEQIAETLAQYRYEDLSLAGWPDCAPASNDKRMAREFLLFLSNYSVCRKTGGSYSDEKYYLDEILDFEVLASTSNGLVFANDTEAETTIDSARQSALPSLMERVRIATTVLARPGQARFRQLVLTAYGRRCFLTGEEMPEVLEAAHIIPVTDGGSDDNGNGICLRCDVHQLFDSGNIRFRPNGELAFSDAIKKSNSYKALPTNVTFPAFVNSANVKWRYDYR
jgi:hypothetical protein